MINKIIQGDCLEVMKGIPDGSVDLIITDPPYSTPTITSFGRKKVYNIADLSIQEFYVKGLKVGFERVLKPDGRLFIFCDDKYYPVLFSVFYDWGHTNLLVWDKMKIGMGRPFRRRHELIMYANRESYDFQATKELTHYPTVLQYKVDKNRIFGAQKPLRLISDLISGFSNRGDMVLDTFMGSGTTAIAALETGRNFIGIELNEEYCNMARERVERYKQC